MKDSLRKRLRVALQHHQAGRWDQAERMYRGILNDHPTQPDTLHLLGVLNLQAGRAAAAVSLLQRAVAQRAEFAEAHLNLGAAHHKLGELPAAIAALERAIAVNPALAEAHSNLGDVYRLAGRIDEALAACQRALAINPQYPNALNHFGLALSAAGRKAEAIAAYESVIALQPRHLEALRNLAAELLEQRRCAESIELLHRALAMEPHDPRSLVLLGSAQELLGDLDAAERTLRRVADAPQATASTLVELGVVLQKQGRHNEAVSYFERAVQQRPEYAEALFNWAHSLHELRRTREGLDVCRRGLALQPDSPQGLTNLGVLLHGCDQVEEAVAVYRRALELNPDHADAWSNLGAALYEMSDYKAGRAACERALTIDPDSGDAHFNRALFLLMDGDLVAGWQGYERRLRQRTKRSALGKTTRPKWDGSPLNGRRLLLVAEQGLGDTFQFIRYAPLLRERGGVILAAVPRRMVGILSSCPGIAQLVAEDDPWPDHDVYCEMLSVCQHLTPSVDAIPAPIPYLAARPDLIAKWRDELAAYPGFRVGIAWQGSNSEWDYRRVPLENFEHLARVPGVRLVSLQADGGAQVRAARFPVIDFTDRIDREPGAFQDTAAILMNLDLVVSSDTSVPHLAGALKRPVWLALRKSSEWRWQRGRQDTPWYPTMRLYRQTTRGDWADLLRRMADDLSRLVVGSDPEST